MKPMSERNPIAVGAVGCSLVAAALLGALNYDKLPLFDRSRDYAAYFEDAAGLRPDSPVEVSGLRVGQVSRITLDGNQVLVNFRLDDGIQVGDRSEAAIKTKTLLGAKFIEITPRGEGHQSAPIPIERTTSPTSLPTRWVTCR